MAQHHAALSAFCFSLVLLLAGCATAGPVLRIARADSTAGQNLLKNPGFEQAQGRTATSWSGWKNGYTVAPGAGRNGSQAAYCRSPQGHGEFGASQTVLLKQTEPHTIVVRGYSKARNVSGGADSGYSLYVDLIYNDGTPLWGRNVKFSTGTHDWQRRELFILPEKPVQRLTVYCLFRGHAGEVWFDDIELFELRAAGKMVVFDGQIVEPIAPKRPPRATQTLRTADGLSLRLDARTGAVASLAVDGRELALASAPSGFFARAAAQNSDFEAFAQGSALGLRLEPKFEARPGCIVVSGTLTDATAADRAITLVFALPLDARGWRWWDNILAAREISAPREYSTVVPIGAGATGALSQYPFACVSDDLTALCLAIDMDEPRQYRLGYNAGTRQLYIAFDFGLSPATAKFPSQASFRFVIFRADPRWGFRSAAKRYYELFPHLFQVRSKKQGIWMPFTDVSTVQGWEDFGFRYHEGINNVPFDDAHDILSFRYTEPSTYWMRMDPSVPRTYEAAIAQLREQAEGKKESLRRQAVAVLTSGSYDEQGRFQLLFRNAPWCNGAVFSLCPLPGIPGEWTDAKLAWNEEIKQRYYGPGANGEQDGEYLDSLEGYVTANLNFRREHFAAATIPLTFDTQTKRPAIHKAFAVFEFVRWISADVHNMGKLMMANGVPNRFTFLCGNLDIMGTETNWMSGGRWRPMSHARMALRRTMCAKKPYLFLMNTDYDNFPPQFVEKYFLRSLFWGMFPSMFSPTASSYKAYWRTPAYYNRDRHLFKKYQPTIKRVAEAGWDPITHARADAEGLLVERFGPADDGSVYFTVFNDSAQELSATITVDAQALRLPATLSARELLTGRDLPLRQKAPGKVAFTVTLKPEWAAAVRLAPR